MKAGAAVNSARNVLHAAQLYLIYKYLYAAHDRQQIAMAAQSVHAL